ncbi:MAG: TonB-dependent receptor [Bacteroidia bacterium]|nr:TonB-dependent receptor [Bacteroidia bacterium]
MKTLAIVLLGMILPISLFSQIKTQTIRGKVWDAISQQPIVGATVFVENTDPRIGSITDNKGSFKLENVPIGRRTVVCKYPGYSDFISDNQILTSAKELFVEIALEEQIGEATSEEVFITAKEYPTQAVNKLSVVSTRSFSSEETQRYPAAVNDPGRMALAFPGVQQGGDDSENDIIIRGNSSFGMLWRLEGIDIPNPNHFARPGTSGGGITVFSAQLLANSDFSSGGMAAEYGNAISGAMDIHFRKGNMENREYRAKISLLGLDFATEGPLKKGNSSYLANYRFSTLSLLNKMGFYLVGERVENDFQDFSFNLAFDGKNGKSFTTVFGMGGLSLEHYLPVANPAERDSGRADHWEDRIQGSNMAALGVTHTRLLDEKSHLKFVVAALHSHIFRDFDVLDLQDNRFKYNDETYLDNRITASVTYQRKISERTSLKTGMFFHQTFFTFNRESFPRSAVTDITNTFYNKELSISGKGNTQTLQYYAQFSQYLTEKLVLNAGGHVFWLLLNNTGTIEPRVSLTWSPTRRQKLSFAYGLHSQMLPLGAYFYARRDTAPDQTVTVSNPNFDLKMIRSNHLILSYNYIIGKGLRLGIEGYMQRMSRVPVENASESVWWMLNDQSGIAQFELSSGGRGLNYGVDLALEKFFSRGIFFLLTYSRFESTYELPDGRVFNTRFGTKFSSSYTLGKEFTFKNQSVLQIGARLLYNGGFRYTPPDYAASETQGTYVADKTQTNEGQVEPYARIDGRISYRTNRKGRASNVFLDIQNVTDRRNTQNIGYDPVTKDIYYRTHPSGFIPVLGYQFDF